METELHRTLKAHYADHPALTELRLDRYRIDAIDSQERLVEVQHAGLSAIRDKIADLLRMHHTVRLVKPVIANKWITTLEKDGQTVARRRRSPKRGTHRDIFGELLHFTRVYPHPRLILEVPLIDVDEVRLPKKKRWHRAKAFRVVEQRVLAIGDSRWLTTPQDLLDLADVPREIVFDTAELATWMERPRWFAQQVAYVLKHCGAVREVGKRGNSRLYQAMEPVPAVVARSRRRRAA